MLSEELNHLPKCLINIKKNKLQLMLLFRKLLEILHLNISLDGLIINNLKLKKSLTIEEMMK